MTLYLITAPTDEVVTVAEARAQLRGSVDADDAVIEALIKSAVNQIDPAGGGWLGRALRPQTWELRGSQFPSRYDGCGYDRNFHRSYEAELPYPPLLVVDSVKYDDGDGVETTLTAGVGYRVIGAGSIGKARIVPIYNGSWPSSVRADDESVRIRFTAGYEDTTAGDELPAPIKQAVILMVKHLYDIANRNMFVSERTIDGVGSTSFFVGETTSANLKSIVENILMPYRVWD